MGGVVSDGTVTAKDSRWAELESQLGARGALDGYSSFLWVLLCLLLLSSERSRIWLFCLDPGQTGICRRVWGGGDAGLPPWLGELNSFLGLQC